MYLDGHELRSHQSSSALDELQVLQQLLFQTSVLCAGLRSRVLLVRGDQSPAWTTAAWIQELLQ